jgi:TonB family protein
MATASRQASSTSDSFASDPSLSSADVEPATVEESTEEETDLLGILRKTASTSPHPVDSILAPVADAARVMSQADGTALAIETDGVIVCRARSGNIAPGLGAVISSESGISGECLRAAAMLVCYDTESDPRVDAEVCRALGIRSIAAVPLLDRARSIGILEAFSGRPNAFDGDALSSLRALADVAQTAYRREFSSATDAEPVTPVPTALPVTAIEPKKYVARTFAAEEITSADGQQHRNRVWLATIIAVAVVLTVVVAWWAWHGPDETTGNPQTAHAAAAIASATAKPVVRETLPKPTPSVSGKHATSRPDIVVENAAEIQPVDRQPASSVNAAPESMSAATTKAAPSEPMVPEAPTVTLVPSNNPAELARLTSIPAQMPAGGPTVSQGVIEPVLVHRVDPSYPTQARNQRLSGKVTLAATIGKDGIVRGISLVSGSQILAESAKSAVRQWRYRPGSLNGTPIEIQKEITFVFAQP